MNVLYIGSYDSIHDLKWMRFFSEQDGYSVYFVCESQQLSSGVSADKAKTYYAEFNIHFLGTLESFSIRKRKAFNESGKWLRAQILELQIDLVHILFASPHALWGKFIDTPYFITTRGSDILRVIPELKKQSGLKGLYYRYLFSQFKKYFQKAAVITGTSVAQVEKCEALFQVKGEIIRTGINVNEIEALDADQFLPEVLKDKQFIFSPRFMAPVYDIRLQLDAIEKLDRSILENYLFVFIRGKQFEQDYYHAQLDKLEALKKDKGLNFQVFDYLDQYTLWSMYKKASLTVMTPISDGTPNSALEAMAAECPLIIPDLEYDKEVFKNVCIKLDDRNPSALAELISKVLYDYPERLIARAHQNVMVYGNRDSEMLKLHYLYKKTSNKSY